MKSSPLEHARPSVDVAPGMVIGGCYKLSSCLGEGGFGQVWRARDERTQEDVALKIVSSAYNAHGGWYEAYLMRQLELPGVVRLLDEGRDMTHNLSFLVMNLVGGASFPGGDGSRTPWLSLAPSLYSLMMTLHRVHAQGVLHLDLKPENVLLDLEAGDATVLDFGLSRQLLSESGKLVVAGTLAYISPEQLKRQPTSPRTDLYALGVMCYQALCGELPRHGDTMRAHLRALLRQQPPSFAAQGVEGAPEALEALVMSMLQVDPLRRPSSMMAAAQELERLVLSETGERLGQVQDSEDMLPGRLLDVGFSAELDALTRGLPWVFRTTALHHELDTQALLALIQREHPSWKLWRLPEAQKPYGSLMSRFGANEEGEVSLEVLQRDLRASILGLEDVCLIVEQERVDAWSWALLVQTTCRQVMCSQERSVARALMTPEQLMRLFAGHELWLSLRSRAARALYAQTNGELFTVWRTLQEWRRLGLIDELGHEGRYLLDESKLRRMERGERGGWSGEREVRSDLFEHEQCLELLVWIMVSKGRATVSHCMNYLSCARWEVEVWLEELDQAGFVMVDHHTGRLWADALCSPLEVWSTPTFQQNHLRLAEALEFGDPQRLTHLVQGGAHDRALDAVLDVVQRLDGAGELIDAVRVLRDMSMLARHRGEHAHYVSYMTRWACLVMNSESLEQVENFLMEMGSAERWVDELHDVVEIVRLLRSQLRRSDQAFDYDYLRAHVPGEQHAPRLELNRLKLFLRAARTDAQRQAFMDEVKPWFDAQSEELKMVYVTWQGLALRDVGDFVASAECHERVLTQRLAHGLRYDALSTVYNMASMWINALEYDRAEQCYREHEGLLSTLQGGYIIRHRYLGRRLRYVLGQDDELEVEPEIEGLVRRVGVVSFEGVAMLTEAAIAWRKGAYEQGARYARMSEQVWRNFGAQAAELLSYALGVRCGLPRMRDEQLVLQALEQMSWPRLVVQTAGLLGEGSSGRYKNALRQLVTQRMEEIPEVVHDRRLEVISVREACALLDV